MTVASVLRDPEYLAMPEAARHKLLFMLMVRDTTREQLQTKFTANPNLDASQCIVLPMDAPADDDEFLMLEVANWVRMIHEAMAGIVPDTWHVRMKPNHELHRLYMAIMPPQFSNRHPETDAIGTAEFRRIVAREDADPSNERFFGTRDN